ncbi:metallophosphoesterase [Anatilimnocola aggregata]|nr:metallophosphoesterase [Anatilimnocola aggregata]
MELALFWLLLPFAVLGHFASAIWLFNRLHAEVWPYRFRQVLERLLFLASLTVPVLIALQLPVLSSLITLSAEQRQQLPWFNLLTFGYLCFTLVACLLIVPWWLVPKLRYRVPSELVRNETQRLDLGQQLPGISVQGVFPRLCASLPGNQVLHLHVQTKTLRLPNLPRRLAGLKIAHLTDIHLTGKISRDYFAEIIRRTNDLQPDLIALTGDIAERTRCLPWIQPLFGALQAPLGKFFIFGNHDFLLPDTNLLLEEMRASGFVDLGGDCQRLNIRDTPVLIAGNELPWQGPAPEVPPRIPDSPSPEFRLLLAHTPDLFSWAQSHQFDLMLAGHNHGGQIRFPLIGPLISPSRFGVRYAAGVFREGPTFLHVGRGISGEHLLRFNCPPELTLLVLE